MPTIKIHSFEALGSKAMTDAQRLEWLIGRGFNDQLDEMRNAVSDNFEAQQLLADLIDLRAALITERRARTFRYITIGLSLAVIIGTFIGLSILSSGGVSVGAIVAVVAAHQLAAIGALVASILLPYIPDGLRMLADYLQSKKSSSVINAFAKLDAKVSDGSNIPNDKILDEKFVAVNSSIDHVNKNLNSWWPYKRNNALGAIVGKFALKMQDHGINKVLIDANELEKLGSNKAEISPAFTSMDDLQNYVNSLTEKQAKNWLMSDAFSNNLSKLEQRALASNNENVINLVQDLNKMRNACKTKRTSAKYLITGFGMLLVGALAIALDLSGAAGSATSTIYSILGTFEGTPLLQAGGIIATLSPMAFARSYSLYKQSSKELTDIKIEVKTLASHLQTESSVLSNVKSWLKDKRARSSVGSAVKMAITGIATELNNGNSGECLDKGIYKMTRTSSIDPMPAAPLEHVETVVNHDAKSLASKRFTPKNRV